MIWKLVLVNLLGHMVPHSRNKLLESFTVAEYLVISGVVGIFFGVAYLLYGGGTIAGMLYKITHTHVAMLSYNNLIAIIQSVTIYGLMSQAQAQTGGSVSSVTNLLTSISIITTYVIGMATGQEQFELLKVFSVCLIGWGTYLFS
jgi:hypothetical protein